jgi:hypothetical protein
MPATIVVALLLLAVLLRIILAIIETSITALVLAC